MIFLRYLEVSEVIRKPSVNYMLQIGLVLSQFLPAALLPVEAAQLVYENTFDNGVGDIGYEATPMTPAGCESTKWSRPLDPAGSGNRVFKVLQQGGQECLVAADLKHRALVEPRDSKGDTMRFAPHTEYWVGYRIFFPADFESKWLDDNGAEIIHYQTNRSSPHGETPSIDIGGNGSDIQMLFYRSFVELDSTGKRVQNKADTAKVIMSRGVWHDVIMNFRLEENSTGFFKVWVDGVQRMNVTGQTDTAASIKPRTKDNTTNLGMYWSQKDRPFDWTIYLDNWRIATGSGGFDLVNPASDLVATPPAAPTNLQLLIPNN